jgi:hypothetical protein
VTRHWDHDKTLPRGDAPGTRGGRPVRLQSAPASRDTGVEHPPRLDPPPDAILVIRPKRSLFHPKEWIAVTAETVEARDGELVAVLRRRQVQAIHIVRRGPLVFADATGRALASVAPVYARARIEALAAVLGVRVVKG